MAGNENSGHPDPSPETRFGGERANRANAGGRTPTKWLRDLLGAARDQTPGGQTHREEVFYHLLEIATSWEVVIKGRGDDAIPVASAKDSIEAAKLLYAYDMGKPVEALEVSNPDGSLGPRVMAYIPSNGRVPGREPEETSGANDETKPAQGETTGGASETKPAASETPPASDEKP